MAQPRTPRHWPIVLAALALTYLVAVVFYPILGFPFVTLDVRDQVLGNPDVRGLTGQNFIHILTSRSITSYYPVRTLTFALDYQIWGLNPVGFKLTGVLTHLANVLLVFLLILRLFRYRAGAEGEADQRQVPHVGEVALAAFAAGIFAVHPVVVEPVSWVGGREELLMTLGALGCFHFHLSARRVSREGGNKARAAACFAGAAFCCAVGCLSNAVGAVIPALITAWDMLTLPRPKLRSILSGTFALWLIGAATFAVKSARPSIPEAAFPWTIPARQAGIALNVYYLNLKTLVWPAKLAFSYDKIMPEDLRVAEVALGGLAATATCVLLWKLRRRTRILFGLLWFCIALAPTSQIMPHHVHRADRFLYLPLVGLAMAAAMALRRFRPFTRGSAAVIASAASGVGVLLLLDTLSSGQVQKWRDDVALWEHCIAVAPDNSPAHCLLADALDELGQADRAAASYRKALELNPNNVAALNNFAVCLTSGDAPRPDDLLLAVGLARRGCRLTGWKDPDLIRSLARAHTALAKTHQAAGRYRPAVDHYHKAIDARPGHDPALFHLALLLSTCPDESLREPNRAVWLAERGCELANPPDARRLSILAIAYGEAGRFEDAAAVTRKAIEAARNTGDTQGAKALSHLHQRFEKRLPLTASP